MQIVSSLDEPLSFSDPFVCTFGTFDGVHLGHAYIFDQVKKSAQKNGCKTAVITFSNHPSMLVTPQNPVLPLTQEKQKLAYLEPYFDLCFFIAFTEQVRDMEPEIFFEKIAKRIQLLEVIVGKDVRFGKAHRGNAELLQQIGKRIGFSCRFLERKKLDNRVISSSEIRSYIAQGNMLKAAELLGRPFSIICECTKRQDDVYISQIDKGTYCMPPDGIYRVRINKNEHAEVILESFSSHKKLTIRGAQELACETGVVELSFLQ